jgi:ribonuclease VapC
VEVLRPRLHQSQQPRLELYKHYGKGSGHPAQLNYGDCFAAAIATMRQIPLLYAGTDFHAAGF